MRHVVRRQISVCGGHALTFAFQCGNKVIVLAFLLLGFLY
jgi:hypothetical protein